MVDWRGTDTAGAMQLTRQLLAGGARVLQLRMKSANARDILRVGDAGRRRCSEAGATFIVNDRLDLALALCADGVHLGQDDLPVDVARLLCGPEMIIGASTHNESQATKAVAAGADYLGVGPIFPTKTKDHPDPVVGTGRLQKVCSSVSVPVVAIGGINLKNVLEVGRTGAKAAALISAVNGAGGTMGVTAAAKLVSAAFGL